MKTEALGNKEETDTGNILKVEPRGLGDGLDTGDEGKISDEEAEIEIICGPLGRIIFEEETKGKVPWTQEPI